MNVKKHDFSRIFALKKFSREKLEKFSKKNIKNREKMLDKKVEIDYYIQALV